VTRAADALQERRDRVRRAELADEIYFAASRGLHSAEEWGDWLAGVAQPEPSEGRGAGTVTEADLAWRHNTTAFLFALYLNAREGGDPEAEARLVPGLLAAIRSLP
jgi:hypothetical protein